MKRFSFPSVRGRIQTLDREIKSLSVLPLCQRDTISLGAYPTEISYCATLRYEERVKLFEGDKRTSLLAERVNYNSKSFLASTKDLSEFFHKM